MNQDEKQALKDKYQQELIAMDAKSDKLDELQKAKYQEQRNDFSKMLDSLGDAAEDQWEELKANLEKGWDSLRAFWHGLGDDNEAKESNDTLDDIDDSKSHN